MKEIVKELTRKTFCIDTHVHLGPRLRGEFYADDLLQIMDRNEIDQAVVSPSIAYPRPNGIKDTMRVNDKIAQVIADYPKRFPCGLGIVEPLYGERSFEEIDRILDILKLKGLMLHNCFQGLPLDHPFVFELFEQVGNRRIVALVHTGYDHEEPWRLARLAEAFPDITFISGHSGTQQKNLRLSLWLCKKYDNLFLDTSNWLVCGLLFEKAVAEIGAERLLFGDDIPHLTISYDLLHTKLAEISQEEKELILWKNAARIYNIK